MLKIFNTLGKQKDDFRPIKKNQVSFYQCGPTVYWTQHIGNMRAMVLADLIRRSLEYLGYKVKFARNYTDVGHLTGDEDEGEDKLQVRAKREGMTPQKIADKYIKQFEADVKALNCEGIADQCKPRATKYIKPMEKMVQKLIDGGWAYATDLAIYFDVKKYIADGHDYTALSGQKLDKNIIDAGKGEVGDKNKKSAVDFAVWFFKAGAHENALQTWKHRFKRISQLTDYGFPGWHLECSAMVRKLFGPTIDIHMGGIEHVPVHHTNEIAQSEAANGVKFVNYWLHNEHLTVDGKKMSKSSGTAYSLDDIIAKGYDPMVLRYFFLQAHYRSQQNFTWEALQASQTALNKLYAFIQNKPNTDSIIPAGARNQIYKRNSKQVDNYKKDFLTYISDDFIIPAVVASIWEIVNDKFLPYLEKKNLILDFDRVLGLGLSEIKTEKIPTTVVKLAAERQKARVDKNWGESDRLRDEIAKLGWQIEDTKDGSSVLKKK